jgi:hypothetical protein
MRLSRKMTNRPSRRTARNSERTSKKGSAAPRDPVAQLIQSCDWGKQEGWGLFGTTDSSDEPDKPALIVGEEEVPEEHTGPEVSGNIPVGPSILLDQGLGQTGGAGPV